MNVAVCAIAKLENNYIKEWVEHYKKLGFDNVILFDNNDFTKGEHFEKVIRRYIKSGFVIIENVRGKKCYQYKAYNDCYKKYSRQFDWIGFFDIDEFLVLFTKGNIKEFLNQKCFSNFNCIKINWQTFDDNDLLYVKHHNYSVKRFTRAVNLFNEETKCIFRTNIPNITINSSHGALNIAGITSKLDNHNKENIKSCDTVGNPCENISVVKAEKFDARVNHYWFKTIEEYLLNKTKRGDVNDDGTFRKGFFKLDTFFLVNKKTDKKIKYYNYLTYVYVDGNPGKITTYIRKIKFSLKSILVKVFPNYTFRGKIVRYLYKKVKKMIN